jgi:hypothetical protein
MAAWKNLKSTDPRKPAAVAAIRAAAGVEGGRVTCVKIRGNEVKGDVLAYEDGKYANLGTVVASLETEPAPTEQIKVRMSSQEFGNEAFYYNNMPEALAGIERLVADAEKQNDEIERIIGIVVNEEE